MWLMLWIFVGVCGCDHARGGYVFSASVVAVYLLPHTSRLFSLFSFFVCLLVLSCFVLFSCISIMSQQHMDTIYVL